MLSACGGGSSAPIIEPVASNQVPARVSEENPTSEVKVITQTIDGLLLDRPYLIRYPENPSEENYPAVFFFHDTGENGERTHTRAVRPVGDKLRRNALPMIGLTMCRHVAA